MSIFKNVELCNDYFQPPHKYFPSVNVTNFSKFNLSKLYIDLPKQKL